MTVELPPHLLERVAPGAAAPRSDGAWVVYWMRTAVRAEENPALDVALWMARALGVPAFVYHALDERYPYASDRHHTFILEGARDAARALAARGVGYAFHLARPGHRGPHLKTLASQACVVVTEDFPWAPIERWTAEVERAAGVPVWRVDTACVVPFRRVGRAHERAFAFRDATASELAARIHRPWHDVAPGGPAFLPELPFEPVDLERAHIPALVASCAIDHSVGPVHHTPGGAVAGRARWRHFLEHGLARYASERSNPLRPAGASRLSAYLHYGMVSPLGVARDAAAHRTDGAAKFIDELHTWREVCWSFCAFTPNPESVSCLPAWARATLAAHTADARPSLPSWETLSRAHSEDAFWNVLQTSLLVHGELHNQVRMTWGKALLQWTPDASRALELLIDLNHRYALDGRDPGSYGGILWCLGLFDRPHNPERPVFGAVRARPTEIFAQRFDVPEYTRRVRRPTRGAVERVAVIGGGIAGCTLARILQDAGHDVTVFDKGRRAGGRMSTRRIEDSAALTFDHGVPYFTIRDPRLLQLVESWRHDGIVADAHVQLRRADGGSDGVERLVATPKMSALVARIARDLRVELGVTITALEGAPGHYRLRHSSGNVAGSFTQVAVCVPAPQALMLLEPCAPALAESLRAVRYAPRVVAMAAFDDALQLDDVVLLRDQTLSFVVRDNARPGRAPGERLVLHGSDAWSAAHIEEDPQALAAVLLDALWRTTGHPPVRPRHVLGHRWRFAVVTHPAPGSCLFDERMQLGVAGDAFGGEAIDGVEAALLSASALAGRFLALPAVADAGLLQLGPDGTAAQMTIW